MARPTLVFDLDGTLVDTAPDLFATLEVILAAEDCPPLPFAEARGMIGAGARALIERGLAASGRRVTQARLDALYTDFLEHYAGRIAVLSRPFPGAEAALGRLAAKGHALTVCTNKTTAHARLLLESLGLAARFGAICGRDAFAVAKPDPDHLRLTVRAAGGDPAGAIMIGDSLTDLATARAAAVPAILVDFGYTDVPASALGADRVIGHFDALDAALDGLIAIA